MEHGIVGLGRMGGNMARRLLQSDIRVVGYNRTFQTTQQLANESGLETSESIPDLVSKLDAPRIVWMMLPSGDVTEAMIDQLIPLLDKGDILVDGANSWFKDSVRRADKLHSVGIHYVDAGVSGGIWGLENGYALMVGGDDAAIQKITPLLKILAPAADKGWLHCGPSGSGHYVKMIHNGIEYGMMQAYAEGFALMKAREDFAIDLGGVAEMWRHGSVVRSWLLDLSADFLAEDQELDDMEPYVADSGEGRWTAIESIERGVPTPVMSLATMMRFSSQGKSDYSNKMLAMMRKGFGGHAIKKGK